VKVIVFHAADELASNAKALLKTLCCEVLSTHDNRYTIKTSRGNLQSIKRRWLEKRLDTAISQELNICVSQIIIGGSVN
jgi:hypothetical protein